MGTPAEEGRVLRRWVRRSRSAVAALPPGARALLSSRPLVEVDLLRGGEVILRPVECDFSPAELGRKVEVGDIDLISASGARGW